MDKTVMCFGLLVILVGLLFPLAILWMLNTLFNLQIEYTWTNYIASYILYVLASGIIYKRSK